jgi:hypothetical protein
MKLYFGLLGPYARLLHTNFNIAYIAQHALNFRQMIVTNITRALNKKLNFDFDSK